MRQSVQATVERYLSICCQAPVEQASFSDGRGFLICLGCSKVLAVEPKRSSKRASP